MTDPALSDSAGVPWEGRSFRANPSAGDDGSAPAALVTAREEFRAGRAGLDAVVAALHGSRLLLPLLAEAGDEGVGPHGQRVDKTQELALVTSRAPDGRVALPAFTSVATMSAWDPSARPIPIEGPRVALALGAEQTPLLAVDPGTPEAIVLRRPAFRAIATGEEFTPGHLAPEVLAAARAAIESEQPVRAVAVEAGDPMATLAGPDARLVLGLVPGLTRAELDALVARIVERWSQDPDVVELCDTLGVRVTSS